MTTKFLKCIGKGQITIPLEWRTFLGLHIQGIVRAEFDGNTITIKKVPSEKKTDWSVENISLNEIGKADQQIIKKGRKAYKEKDSDSFFNIDEFFEA